MVSKLLNKLTRSRPNNRLLFRYYFAIIFGIAALALLLDLVFYPWIKNHETQRMQNALYTLANEIAEQHLSHGGGNSEQTIDQYTLRIFSRQNVHTEQTGENPTRYSLASNQRGQSFLNWPSRDGQHWVQFGPLQELQVQPDWPTWIFYGSLFVLVSLWLQPLLKDLDRISRAVDDFRNDYRAPLPQLKNSSNLKPLANNIATMAEKIRQLIDTQKDLSNVLSHEMRTPLSRVKFSLALLRSDNQLSAEQQAELEGIDQDLNELQQLTQAMLDFAKLDHPDMAIEPQELNASQWLTSYVDKQKRHCEHLALNTVIDNKDNSDVIIADPYWLELALSNLIANAIRYAKTKITLFFTVTHHGFNLTVTDDGPGIEQAEQHQVTKPFYQATTKNNKGFGLGLALVNRIAQLHNGQVAVGNSALGGAEVTIKVRYRPDRKHP